MVTYRVQIIDEPGQIVALKVWYTLLILLPIKHLAELDVELGRRPIEAVEFLQGRKVG